MSCNTCNSSCCCCRLVCLLCSVYSNIHSTKIVHAFIPSSTVKNDLYRITTSPRVLGKLQWATKLFDLNGTIKKQHMHIISKMFVFIWRKVLIYKNWTWIVFTFCKIKTLIVIFISWAAYHWRKWFTSFSSTYVLSASIMFSAESDYG